MKITYVTPLQIERWIEKDYEDDIGCLLAEYQVVVDDDVITVPAGFVFGPSIPKFARSFVSVADCLEGSCVHDWFYRTGSVSRKRADLIFRQMVEDVAGSWRARRAWLGVHFGAKSSYMDPKWDKWREKNGF